MLEDDYKRIIDYFHQSIEGKPLNLQDLCEESLQFFEKLKQMIENGTDKEKEEAMLIMSEMYKKLISECKELTEKTGLTEEQILAFAENPNNFSPDQWEMIQDTRRNMMRSGEALARFLEKGAKKKEASPTEKKKIHKPKKSNWLRT
jgi:hypothetical protein